jgi:hypothetical protein
MATVRFVDRAGRRARATQRLSPTEVALLEVLGDWDEVVDAPAEARDRLVSLIHSGTVRPDRLAAASETEPANVRGRLRALLHDADEAAAANRVRQPSGRVAAMLALP